MKKVIKLTESDLINIVKRVMSEQSVVGAPNNGVSSKPNRPVSTVKNNKFTQLCSILFKARDVSWADGFAKTLFNNQTEINMFGAAIVNWAGKNPGYDTRLLNGSICFIFRESKGTSATFSSPKEILGATLNLFGGNHSQGYAQIQPETAKSYGINMKSLYTFEGSLDAVYKILSSNYEKAKKYYNGATVTIYQNKVLKQVPAIGGDAALHLAVAAHNAGSGIINQWCETNIPGLANLCSIKDRKPYDDKPNYIAVTNTNKKIPNYFPNIGGVHNYMPQFIKCYNVLTPLPALIPQSLAPASKVEPNNRAKFSADATNAMVN
jgi:ATP-dependent Clp protease adapter protein ClpS